MAVRAVGISTSFVDKPLLPRSVKPTAILHAHIKSSSERKQQFISPSGSILPKRKANDGLKFSKSPHMLSLLFAFLGYSGEAKAMTKEDIVTALSQVEDAYQKVEGAASTAYGVSKEALDQVVKVLSPAMDAAMPYVQKATNSAVQIASPLASDVTQQAQKALESVGVDTKPAVEVAKSAVVVAGQAAEQTSKSIEGAKPIASATIESLVSADPILLAEGAGLLILLYLLLPKIGSALSFSLRGYKGDLTPPQALELLTKKDYVMIDIRSEKEKSKNGVPSLPRNAKNKLFSIPIEELSNKMRGLLRNSKKVEAEMAALKVSYMKRVNKGSRIVIMDSYGDVAKIVARALTGMGFKNTWILNDGFSGSRGWLQSCLGTDSYNSSFAEILSPSRIISAGRGRFGTSDTQSQPRRLLASGLDDS